VTDTTAIPEPDWEVLIGQIAQEIHDDRTPQRILLVRAKFYDLLTHCIPPSTVLRTLAFKLIPLVDDVLKPRVIEDAAEYEHRIKTGTKAIFHLEAFVVKFMKMLEEYLLGMDF